MSSHIIVTKPKNYSEKAPFDNPLLDWASYVAVLLIALLHAIFFAPPGLVDDAYISFRYSANLANGLGLVFNPGEQVEGYSNPLWTILLAGAAKLNLALPYSAWWLGIICMLATIALTMKLAEVLTGHKIIGYTAGLGLALSMSFVVSSQRGLETALFGLMLILAIFGLFTKERFSTGLLAIGLGGMAITRPEGLFLAPVLLGFFLFRQRHTLLKNNRPGSSLWVAVGVALFIGLVEVARIAFYHELLPMSVIAKRDQGGSSFSQMLTGWKDGFGYVENQFGRREIVLTAFSALAAMAALYFVWRQKGFYYLTCGAVLSFGLVVAVSNKGDWMPQARLLTPYFPELILLFSMTFYDLAIALAIRLTPNRLNRAAWILPLVWLTLFTVFQPYLKITLNDKTVFTPAVFDSGEDLFGQKLSQIYAPGDIYAIAVLGRISYYSRPTPITDMVGLTEPTIAKWPTEATFYGKWVPQYIAGLNPTLIQHNDWNSLPALLALCQEKYVAIVSPTLYSQRIFVFVRADAAERIGKPLVATFGGELSDPQTAFQKLKQQFPKGQ